MALRDARVRVTGQRNKPKVKRAAPKPKQTRRVKPSEPAETPLLKLHKKPLFFVLLTLPLLAALGGFARLQVKAPDMPTALVEEARRGMITTRDGTILAEGAVEHRRYPEGKLAAQVVGFSGAVQPDGRYGLEGLEYALDSRLQTGEDVVLTLDPSLQAIAQAELRKAAQTFEAENGAMVMLEADTGRVLAAASYPEFEPQNQGRVQERSIISNRAFLQQVEPGSTMKPFVVAALMESGRLTVDETLEVGPWMRVGSQEFKDVATHEPVLGIPDILRYSSNVGMIKLGERFSSEELSSWLYHFGFGRDVGLKDAYTRPGHINPWQNWVPQDHASATIGQSVSTTALQLAAAYSIFANDGIYVPPQLLEDEVTFEKGADGEGNVRTGAARVLSPEVSQSVKEMLTYTVENSGLRVAKIPGVEVAGKSGTADIFDNEKGEYIHAGTLLFAGMFPADDPRVTAVVYLQKPKESHLSTYVAAPVFRAVGSETVALWGLPPKPGQVAGQ